ncbi:MAG: response regulator transcription factor [Anaerolineae bacterium]|nr:response regulator transcription factor [Anaerolineae bacterium]
MPRHYSAIITDQQAEGSPKSYEQREPLSPRQSMTIPALHTDSLRAAPVAETGIIAAVVVTGEGSDNSETQDAMRTTAETQTVPVQAFTTTHQVSALIVEDTFELAEILQITLQRMHIVTAHESHVARAVARYHEMKPDVVLLDIGLPDGPGWNFLERVKAENHQSGGKMPAVIVITAYGDPANRLVGKLHGVDSYLIKPFTPHEVERTVQIALSSAAG